MERLKLNIQKFASSSVQSNAFEGRYLKLTLEETSTSIPNNTSTVRWTLESIGGESTYYTIYNCSVVITYAKNSGDATVTETVRNDGTVYWSDYIFPASKGSVSGTITVKHKNDGTALPVNFTLNGKVYNSGTEAHSGSLNLSTIPRYPTSVQSLRSKTETSITMNWSSDSTIDYVWYSTNNGTNWTAVGGVNATSGSYTISNLSANTTYNIKTRVRRKDSQLTADSSASAIATYNWPNCTSAPNFIIGNSVTLQFFNPLNRTFDIRLWSHTSQSFISDSITISGTSYTFTPDASTLYASIPNSKSSVYNVDSTYNTHKIVKTGGSYSANETTSKPTFSDFTYADTNATTLALTGNNQIVVQNYSNITATVSTTNKAVANNSASMVRYNLVIGNNSASVNYSDDESVSATLNNVSSNIINLYAEDSRGLTTLVSKTATLKAYTTIQKNEINVERANNVGTGVTLTYDGTLWGQSFGSVTNTGKSARYRFKKTNEDWPQTWNGTTTITPTTSGNNYSFTGGIAGDLGNTGFSAEYSFNIEVEVFDELSSTVFSFTLGTGVPHIAVADNGIAIKQPYNTTTGGALQVNGATTISGQTKILGTAGSQPLIVRGISGATSDGAIDDLYLQYGTNKSIYLGNTGAYSISADGSTYTGKSNLTKKLETIDGRISNANITHTYENNKAHMQLLIASSSMTSNKPVADGFITHYSWDNNNKCSAQLYLPQGDQSTKQLQFRTENGAGTWSGWEDIYRAKTLYENSSGTIGTITLPETSANFKYIDIFYAELNRTERSFVRTYSPNGQDLQLTIISRGGTSSTDLRETTKTIHFNGTSLTTNNNTSAVWFTTGGFYAVNEIRIMKVVGYR